MILGIYENDRRVMINGKILSPKRSQSVFNHSPDGFNWGYSGSGPAQLSLAILLEFFGEKLALKFYQEFKSDVISKIPQGKNFDLTEEFVKNWVRVRIRLLEPENIT